MEAQEYLEKVGMEFKVERTRQQLSREDLAKRSKLSSRTIFQLETGKDSSKLGTLKILADALGKPLKDFM